jgi:hypothetical protein
MSVRVIHVAVLLTEILLIDLFLRRHPGCNVSNANPETNVQLDLSLGLADSNDSESEILVEQIRDQRSQPGSSARQGE